MFNFLQIEFDPMVKIYMLEKYLILLVTGNGKKKKAYKIQMKEIQQQREVMAQKKKLKQNSNEREIEQQQ